MWTQLGSSLYRCHQRSADRLACCVLQLAAVQGLRETQPPSVGMVNVLRRGMEDASVFCRVRGEAALALALGAGTEHNGAPCSRPCERRLLAACS